MDELEGWEFYQRAIQQRASPPATAPKQIPPIEAAPEIRTFEEDARDDVAAVVGHMVHSLRSHAVALLQEPSDCSRRQLDILRRKQLMNDLRVLSMQHTENVCGDCRAIDSIMVHDNMRVCVRCGVQRRDLIEGDGDVELGFVRDADVQRERAKRRWYETGESELGSTIKDPGFHAALARRRRIDHATAGRLDLHTRWANSRRVRDDSRLRDMHAFMQALEPEIREVETLYAAPSVSSDAPSANSSIIQRGASSRRSNAWQLVQEVCHVQRVDTGVLPNVPDRVPRERRKRPLISGTPCYESNESLFRRVLSVVLRNEARPFENAAQCALTDIMCVYRRLGRIIRHNVLLPLMAIWQACFVTGTWVENTPEFMRRWYPPLTLCDGAALGAMGKTVDNSNESDLVRRFWNRHREFSAMLRQPNPSRADGKWSVVWTHDPLEWVQKRACCILRDMLGGTNRTPLSLPSGCARLLGRYHLRLEGHLTAIIEFMQQHAKHYNERRNADLLARRRAVEDRATGVTLRARRVIKGLGKATQHRVLQSHHNTPFVLAMSFSDKSLGSVDHLSALAVAVVLRTCDRLSAIVPELDPVLVRSIRHELRRSGAGERDPVVNQSTRLAAGFGVPRLTLQRAALAVSLFEKARQRPVSAQSYAL